MGRVSRGVQDRVRKRREGIFATNQCWRIRIRKDRPLVAALLLVLSLIASRTSGTTKGQAQQVPDSTTKALLGEFA